MKSIGEEKHSAGSDGVTIKPLGLWMGSGVRLTRVLRLGVGVGMARVLFLSWPMLVLRMVWSSVLAKLMLSLLV